RSIDMDGHRKPSGSFCLDTQDWVAAEWLQTFAAQAGWVIVGHSVSTRDTNYGPRAFPLQRFTLEPPRNEGWKVVSIEALDEPEDVFCAVVPEVGRFTLASGLQTGNCAFISTKEMDKDPTFPAVRLMEMSMLGIGVGFDTQGADKARIYTPTDEVVHYTVADSRAGWC